MLLVQSYNNDLAATAKHLQWPEAKVQAAVNYTEAFADEIAEALDEYRAAGFYGVEAVVAASGRILGRNPPNAEILRLLLMSTFRPSGGGHPPRDERSSSAAWSNGKMEASRQEDSPAAGSRGAEADPCHIRCRTIPLLLRIARRRRSTGRHFQSEQDISQADIGGLIRSLGKLVKEAIHWIG